MSDQHRLNRFVEAQEYSYDKVITELKKGSKQSHWMWFIFPQITGLGKSATSMRYAIKSLEEAEAYFQHPVLGKRLVECSALLLDISGKSASEIFGFPDDVKLHSSMTLFMIAAPEEPVFGEVLLKYFKDKKDSRTVEIVNNLPAA